MANAPAAVPAQSMQGIAVPNAVVDAQTFQKLTRRLTFTQRTFAFGGLGVTDNVPILQTGIVSGLSLKASGTLTVTPGTGTVATTARWPYDIPKAIRVSANGQSNLVNCHGSVLKLRDIFARGTFSDRGVVPAGGTSGVSQVGIGGASPGTILSGGSLAEDAEVWGVGQSVTGIPAGAYPIELNWYIPLAFDEISLVGAIFAQTASTDLNIAIDWAPLTDLFVLTGNATVTLAPFNIQVTGRNFSIPEVNGQIVVPDLSTFHSIIEARNVAIANGDNEVRFAGQGVGRQLMRFMYRVFNNPTGGGPGVPLTANANNFGQQGWRFGGNDTPEVVPDGRHLRYFNERLLNSDIGENYGFLTWDFSKEFAFRDSIDEGTATELRILCNIAPGVALTLPYMEYVQETVFAGASGA